MKNHKKLLLALGVLASAQAASATTIYFSGYVSNVIVTSQAGGFAPGVVQNGMLLNGSFEYNPAAGVVSTFNSAAGDAATYMTGIFRLTIDNTYQLSTQFRPGMEQTSLTTVRNRKTSGKDDVLFQTNGMNAFTDNFIPAPLGGSSYGFESVQLELQAANFSALTDTGLPLAAVLASNLFTARTLNIEYSNGVDEPCGPTGEDFCYASNSYRIVTTLTSVSTVPLPPSMFLMGASLSVLALGKYKRWRTATA